MTFGMPMGAGEGSGGGGGPIVTEEQPASRGRVLVPTLLILGLLVIGWVVFTSIYTDWLWFSSVDKTQVFRVRVLTQLGLFAAFATFMAVALILNIWLAHRTRPAFSNLTAEQASLERYRMSIEPYRKLLTIGVAAMFGLMTGLSASAE